MFVRIALAIEQYKLTGPVDDFEIIALANINTWLIDWWIGLLVDCLIGGLIDWFIGWLVDWLIGG